jgi:hypothetical protein
MALGTVRWLPDHFGVTSSCRSRRGRSGPYAERAEAESPVAMVRDAG